MIHKHINPEKEIHTKLTKSLLDMIVLQIIDKQSMHGYQIITKTRKAFGVYIGPSTVYPLLATLEQKGYLSSIWDMTAEKPRKVFSITSVGKNILKFTENSLDAICKTLHTKENNIKNQLTITPLTH